MTRRQVCAPALAALLLAGACGAPFVGVAPTEPDDGSEAGAGYDDVDPLPEGGRPGIVIKPTLGGSASSGAPGEGGEPSTAGQPSPSEAPRCPELGGAKLVLAGTFCVDESEVTVAHYRAFLDGSPSVLEQPMLCAANATFANNCKYTNPEKEPQRCADWCDARAYCASVGKRLCGATEGGAMPFDAEGSSASDQWYAACSHAGERTYPYGSEYDAAACWGGDNPGTTALTVKSASGCVGGYDGLWDMSGGLAEWVDACNDAKGAPDACRIRGGSSSAAPEQLRCDAVTATARSTSSSYIGFRCCADVVR